MSTMTTIIPRPTLHREPICPRWCVGHGGNFLAWETLSDGSGTVRIHTGTVAPVDSTAISISSNSRTVEVEVIVEERDDHTLTPPMIEIYTGNDASDLTPEACRALATLLIDAAEIAEATR